MSRTIQHFSHPEIEHRAADFQSFVPDGRQHTTLLDLLEIYPDRVVWAPKLNHAQLVRHFRRVGCLSSIFSVLILIFANLRRIFLCIFIEDLNFLDQSRINGKSNPDVENTAYWMQQQFGVSPLFFDGMTSRKFTGNASFVRRRNGKCVSLDGLYRFSSGIGTPLTRVWFSHTLGKNRLSTYMIDQCPTSVKNAILSSTQHDRTPVLLRPLVIDAFLAEDCLNELGEDVLIPRGELIQYASLSNSHVLCTLALTLFVQENSKSSLYTPSQVAKVVENLHALSQLLQVIRNHLTDLHEQIQFLTKVHQRLLSFSSNFGHTTHRTLPELFGQTQEEFHLTREQDEEEDTDDSVLDSIEFMLSKTARLMRWVTNYNERTGIRIHLFFNISAQTDSKINLDIARLTSKIAVSTQRDSSSMITMAAVTMLFLPGTFVSALFSMVFFDTSDNSLTVSRQIWIFPVVTIPLTITVFVLWIFWQRHRNRVEARSLGIDVGDGKLAAVFEGSGGLERIKNAQ
ncbi:hypothetical protein CVT25_002400 [Psilocybe cyanescens]|uniref:Uncharacterized protein n=1 Tax=Psilocybe cyanescens TaxID=93625 RepID=A0A409WK65_PSICY|nr:hypothetical protein CVT25_002400 [Psilocybe cyanescens]